MAAFPPQPSEDFVTELLCHPKTRTISAGVWSTDYNPLETTLSLLSIQMLIITLTTRGIQLLLKPFMVARASADVMTSLLLSPWVLGRFLPDVSIALFPPHGGLYLWALGDVGLIFWFFLMGIQLNTGSVVKKIDRKSLVLAVASLVSSYVIAYSTTIAVNLLVPEDEMCGVHPLFIGHYIAAPSLPTLASTAMQHKVLETRFARLAMTSGAFNQLLLLLLVDLMMAAEPVEELPWLPMVRIIIGFTFIALMFVLSRFTLRRIRNSPSEYCIGMILLATLIVSAITDMLGLQVWLGAFIAGLVMPSGLLAATFIKKIEDITVLLVPLTLVRLGQAIDFAFVIDGTYGFLGLLLILLLSYLLKQMVVSYVAHIYDFSPKEGLMIGALLTTKGVYDALLLSWAATWQWVSILDSRAFEIMMCFIVVNNLLISLTIRVAHRSPPPNADSHCRVVQHVRPDMPFRILSCFHNHHLLPSLIGLVESMFSTPRSPIQLSTLHLVHSDARDTTIDPALFAAGEPETEPIRRAFRSHQWTNGHVSIEHYTRISPYSTMHEDVVNLAAKNSTVLIILPFHKQLSAAVESSSIFRSINQNILANAPCSVGILVNHGTARVFTTAFQHVAVLFFGGPDDREALAFAARVGKQDGVQLSVVRFLPSSHAPYYPQNVPSARQADHHHYAHGHLAFMADNDRDKVVDDYCIGQFQMEMAGKKAVSYTERLVDSGAETVETLHSMNRNHDLFIVGRTQQIGNKAVIKGLEDWNEYPELGVIGDFLASADFAVVSVLVVQQHGWKKEARDRAPNSQEKDNAGEMSHTSKYSCKGSTISQQEIGWQWNLRTGF